MAFFTDEGSNIAPDASDINYTVEVNRATEVKNAVMFDMTVNGVKIYGCSVVKGKNNSMFVSFPSHKGKDGKYYNYAWFSLNDDLQADIIKKVQAKLS